MKLRTHDVTLVGQNFTLHPLTEADWDILLVWNNDREVLYYTEGDDVSGYDLLQVQKIYRTVSQTAYCFLAKVGDRPIGECWLQEMNLEQILREYPNKKCRRIDLMIGEMGYRGRGLGTQMIGLLAVDVIRLRGGRRLGLRLRHRGLQHRQPQSVPESGLFGRRED
jgi:aminoglycoside 6'-N-acetyltransferase